MVVNYMNLPNISIVSDGMLFKYELIFIMDNFRRKNIQRQFKKQFSNNKELICSQN